MQNRKFIAVTIALLATAVCFNAATQVAYAQSDEKMYRGDFVGGTMVITNTGGNAWIVSAHVSGDFVTSTNCTITLNDRLAKTLIIAEGAPSNTLSYLDAAEGIFFPNGSVLTFFSSAPATATNSYRLNTVPKRN